ncbi:hypothetical protein V3528_00605 [Acinetobacter johnsonii]|uniref:hypothetical protein n=1 Tax=Acinetobacter johnsonii TaxID=40214 RepID=UPI00244836D5|nr:hypothetical protein [Acinetobacter johnsonii]MDH1363770.1 hypothetical protein [Acinetobacter johnsonii]
MSNSVIQVNDLKEINKVFEKLSLEGMLKKIRITKVNHVVYQSLIEILIKDFKFNVFFETSKNELIEVLLHWIDGPISQVDWDNVSNEKLNREFNLLKIFFEEEFSISATEKNNEFHWSLSWGEVSVVKNKRDFNIITYLKFNLL